MTQGPGDRRVDAALRRADELAETGPEEHVPIYEDVHNTLQQVLAEAGGPANPGDGPGDGDVEPSEHAAASGDART